MLEGIEDHEETINGGIQNDCESLRARHDSPWADRICNQYAETALFLDHGRRTNHAHFWAANDREQGRPGYGLHKQQCYEKRD